MFRDVWHENGLEEAIKSIKQSSAVKIGMAVVGLSVSRRRLMGTFLPLDYNMFPVVSTTARISLPRQDESRDVFSHTEMAVRIMENQHIRAQSTSGRSQLVGRFRCFLRRLCVLYRDKYDSGFISGSVCTTSWDYRVIFDCSFMSSSCASH